MGRAIRQVSLVAGTLALCGASGVRADPLMKFFDLYCTSGSFQVCASVRVFAAGNTLSMQVWNLSGTFGEAHTITALGLYFASNSYTGDLAYWTAAYVDGDPLTDDNITPQWKDGASSVGTFASVEIAGGTSTKQGASGIVGCLDPWGPGEGGGGTHWATCSGDESSFPGNPHVFFQFTLSEEITTLADLELRWQSQQLDPDNQFSIKCDTGASDDSEGSSYPPCNVVPEPITMALLGSGLAGLGGAGWLRRRRQRFDVQNA